MIGSEIIETLQEEYIRLQESYQVVKYSFAGLRLTRWQLTKLLLAQIWRESPNVAIGLGVVATLLFAWIISALFFRQRSLASLGIPFVGKSKGRKMDFQQMMEEAAKKHPNKPFGIRAFGTDYVVYPSAQFDEIKRLPESRASSLEYLREAFHATWSGIPRHSDEMMKAVSVDLARAIPSLVHQRQQDCATSCDAAIGPSADWKEVTLYSASQSIVVSTNSSAFVGRDLGTSKKWISQVDRLPMAVAIPSILISLLPAVARPLLKPLLFAPAIYTRSKLSSLLKPVLKEDINEYESSVKDRRAFVDPQEKGKVALTSWLLRRYPSGLTNTIGRLLEDYINISFESTTSTAGTLFYIMTELAADPELSDTLRDEIKQIAPDGRLPLTHLNELKKMDSVMRESSRVNPFSHIILWRRVMQPLQLSVGPELPAGTNICVDAHHINFSPDLWENPEKFDGLRHYRARQKPGNEQRFKFANLGSDAPGWGDGPQACPGRMFADNTLKIILAHILMNYDFKYRPGEDKPKKGSMPNGSMYPAMGAKLLFRSRKP
ncbi:Cytochrome P450 monooxygenase CYP1 [Cladobotryum mycophilum]|uniref:Cytochrome P450 monooxygenase CYP1 n=1 Tax=Cladobotryum mycophilum TaxID=491253 RepID=A0ABR0SWY1_9HYPO